MESDIVTRSVASHSLPPLRRQSPTQSPREYGNNNTQTAVNNVNEGYLSDVVPSNQSITNSDFSHDLIRSTKNLEEEFKNKYQVLKTTYELRIAQLSQIVEETCHALLKDDFINEMKQDKTSSIFIPGHIHEIIERTLESEREKNYQQLLAKCHALENSEMVLKKQQYQLQEELNKRTKAFKHREDGFKEQLKKLEMQNEAIRKENEMVNKNYQRISLEANLLEKSYEQSSRELAIIEGIDKEEQRFRHELKEQLKKITLERNSLHEENLRLKSELTIITEELVNTQELMQQKAIEEERNKVRIQELMQNVDQLLEQEAHDNSVVMQSVNQKMQNFRNKMISDLGKEKRVNQVLQEELQQLKAIKDDSLKENRRMLQEIEELNKLLQSEKKVNHDHQLTINSLQKNLHENQITMIQYENTIKHLEEQILQNKKLFQEEMHLMREKQKIEIVREMEMNYKFIEQQSIASKLQQENEITKMQSSLKHSLNYSNLLLEEQTNHELTSTNEIIQLKTSFQREKEQIFQRHRQELAQELQELQEQLSQRHQLECDNYKSLLQQAASNIDKLKQMMKEGRKVIELQKQRIQELLQENRNLQSEIIRYRQKVNYHPDDPHARRRSRLQDFNDENDVNSSNSTTQNNISLQQNQTPTTQRRASSQPQTPATTQQYQNHHHTDQSIRSGSGSAIKSSASAVNNLTKVFSPLENTQALNTSNYSVHSLPPRQELVDEDQTNEHQTLNHSQPQITPQNRSNQSPVVNEYTNNLYYEEFIALKSEHDQLLMRYNNLLLQHQRQEEELQKSQSSLMQYQNIQLENTQLREEKVTYLRLIDELRLNINNLNAMHTALINREKELQAKNSEKVKQQETENTFDQLNAQLSMVTSNHTRKADLPKHENDDDSLQLSTISFQYPQEKISKSSDHEKLTTEKSNSTSSARKLFTNNTLTAGETNHTEKIYVENGVNTTDDYQLITITDELHKLQLTNKLIESKLQHHLSHITLLTEEVTNERQQTLHARKREQQLLQILATVDRQYRLQCTQLRQTLEQVRISTLALPALVREQCLVTLQQFKVSFNLYLKKFHERQEEKLLQKRIALTTIHAEELSTLESKFIEQINTMNKQHSQELQRVHDQLILKAGHAIGSHDFLASSEKLSVSMMTSTSTGSSVLGNTEVNVISTTLPAFESVLKGLTEALQEQEVITDISRNSILSIAHAHKEPSFAAAAAARAIVNDDVDKFVAKFIGSTSVTKV